MCLAVPGRIVKIEGETATVDYGAERRQARLVEPEFHVGDYVIVQAKIVITKVPTAEAKAWLEQVKKL